MGSNLTLTEILEHRVDWHHDNMVALENDGFGPWEVSSMGLEATGGIYILWRQAGYCGDHEREHMQAFCVGNADRNIQSRLAKHRVEQAASNTILTTYVSIWPCTNRAAKCQRRPKIEPFASGGAKADQPAHRR